LAGYTFTLPGLLYSTPVSTDRIETTVSFSLSVVPVTSCRPSGNFIPVVEANKPSNHFSEQQELLINFQQIFSKMKLAILSTVAVLVSSAFLSFAAEVPSQVHIALAGGDSDGNSDKFAVSWNTANQTPTSTVKYGITSGSYTSSSTGSSSAYWESYNHHVVLNSLSPDTVYYYVVGDETEGWSSEFTFKSAPLSTNLRGNYSFFVYGDLGVVNGDPTKDYINNNKDTVSLIWHAGDESYADDSFLHEGCYTKFCYEDTFDTYMKGIEPWASHVPYMVTPGNHEAGTNL
jgi:hypothetical protein